MSWRAFATDGTYRTASDATRTFTTPAAAGPPAPAPLPPARLVAALAAAKLTTTAGKKLLVAYVSSTDATARLEVRRKGKRVVALTGTAKPGRNTLAWTTRAKRKPLATGTYSFTLTLSTPDGQTITTKGTATLTRPLARR